MNGYVGYIPKQSNLLKSKPMWLWIECLLKKHLDKNLPEPWTKTNMNKNNGFVNVTATFKEMKYEWIEM